MAEAENQARTTNVWVSCGSHKPLEEDELHGFSVNLDLNQPDMCILTVKNQGHAFSNGTKQGDEVEVKIGGEGGTTIFKGEVVGIEPFYKTGSESRCVIRAFNRLHRLTRGRFSKTFLKQSDQDIADTLAKAAGLSCDAGSKPKITHDHVYQHNQTNLEFLLLRARRIGYDVWCEDKKLFFKAPDTKKDSGIELKMQDPEAGFLLTSFHPRISTAGQVSKVVVRGWNPEDKEEIVGEAKAKSSKMGKETGDKAAKSFGSDMTTYEVDHPVFSVDEAKAIAEARLGALLMNYITAEASVLGKAELTPGIVVKVTVNTDDPKDQFNGMYMISGATHKYSPARGSKGGGSSGGYITQLRMNRDAGGGK